jgi:hypothetical protein
MTIAKKIDRMKEVCRLAKYGSIYTVNGDSVTFQYRNLDEYVEDAFEFAKSDFEVCQTSEKLLINVSL